MIVWSWWSPGPVRHSTVHQDWITGLPGLLSGVRFHCKLLYSEMSLSSSTYLSLPSLLSLLEILPSFHPISLEHFQATFRPFLVEAKPNARSIIMFEIRCLFADFSILANSILNQVFLAEQRHFENIQNRHFCYLKMVPEVKSAEQSHHLSIWTNLCFFSLFYSLFVLVCNEWNGWSLEHNLWFMVHFYTYNGLEIPIFAFISHCLQTAGTYFSARRVTVVLHFALIWMSCFEYANSSCFHGFWKMIYLFQTGSCFWISGSEIPSSYSAATVFHAFQRESSCACEKLSLLTASIHRFFFSSVIHLVARMAHQSAQNLEMVSLHSLALMHLVYHSLNCWISRCHRSCSWAWHTPAWT